MNTPGSQPAAILAPVPANPATKQTRLISAERRMSFSTTGPKNAADMPRKKIASEKPHSMVLGATCIWSAMSCLNTLQQ